MRVIQGGEHSDGLCIAVDNTGNIYIGGYTTKYSSGDPDAFIAKLSYDGSVKWFRIIRGEKSEKIYDIAIDNANNIYVLGSTNSYSETPDDIDFFISKLSSEGSIEWFKIIGGDKSDIGIDMAIDPLGNIFITGETSSYGIGTQNVFVSKLSPNGSVIWFMTMDSIADIEKGQSILIKENNLYITGEVMDVLTGKLDFFIAKLNQNGSVNWFEILGNYDYDEGSVDIFCDDSGDLLVAGVQNIPPGSSSSISLSSNIFITKLNRTGSVVWSKTLNYSFMDAILSMEVIEQRIYIVGYIGTLKQEYIDLDIVIAELNQTGSPIWSKVIESEKVELGCDLVIENESNIVIAGSLYDIIGNTQAVLITKIDSETLKEVNETYFKQIDTNQPFGNVTSIRPIETSIALNATFCSVNISYYNPQSDSINPESDLVSTSSEYYVLNSDQGGVSGYPEQLFSSDVLRRNIVAYLKRYELNKL
ncbi:MAG: SBBP repeat-containing protein [Candidatus Njordarchaeales archaeon]